MPDITTVRPIANRVLVKSLEEQRPKTSLIIIPDSAKKKPRRGRVLAVGPGLVDETGNRIPCDVRPGDTVYHGQYRGYELKIGGVDYIIMNETDILAILIEEDS